MAGDRDCHFICHDPGDSNTAIETLVDLYTEEYHHLAKVAKDTAAGAVLVAAIMSVCVGLIIFLPKIWQMFFN